MSEPLPQEANQCKITTAVDKFRFPPLPTPKFPDLLTKSPLRNKVRVEYHSALTQRRDYLAARIRAAKIMHFDTAQDTLEYEALNAVLEIICC